MTKDQTQSTLSTSAYDFIRQDILKGELAPGFKLRIDFVSSRYGIGSSPIREALSRLSSDGLVERHEQRGFLVAHISIEQLQEVTRTRCLIEEIAIRESIKNATEESEDSLVVAMHRLTRTNRYRAEDAKRVNPEWEERHATFHDALVENCGSTILLDYCRELRSLADRYRLIAAASIPPRQELDEHKAIFDAMIDRKPDRAIKLLREHYGITQAIIEKRLAEWPSLTGTLAEDPVIPSEQSSERAAAKKSKARAAKTSAPKKAQSRPKSARSKAAASK